MLKKGELFALLLLRTRGAPSLALGDKDKAKYLAIGESDRMTLKFVKPN